MMSSLISKEGALLFSFLSRWTTGLLGLVGSSFSLETLLGISTVFTIGLIVVLLLDSNEIVRGFATPDSLR